MYSVLEIVSESVQQKHLDNPLFDQQVVNFVRKNASLMNQRCTHLWAMRYTCRYKKEASPVHTPPPPTHLLQILLLIN